MRALSSHEISHIAGAGFSEDVVTAAASIYVGSAIGGAASCLSSAAFAGAATAVGAVSVLGPLATAITAAGSVVSPVIFFAAPVATFEALYPGVIAEKVGAYFN